MLFQVFAAPSLPLFVFLCGEKILMDSLQCYWGNYRDTSAARGAGAINHYAFPASETSQVKWAPSMLLMAGSK